MGTTRAAVLILVAACASGGRDVTIDAADPTDGPTQRDAKRVDAPPGAQTKELVQTSSQAIEAGTSIACANNPPGTNANNYYRVFDLAAAGITSDFLVSKVTFKVEDSHRVGTNVPGGSSVAVRVGTYSGTPGDQLDNSMMTILASNPTVNVPEVREVIGPPPSTPGATVDAPITATIPAGSKLLVEIDSPDGHNVYYLYLGANTAAETAPAYVLAPTCKDSTQAYITKPTNISTLSTSFPNVHLLISVTGQYQP